MTTTTATTTTTTARTPAIAVETSMAESPSQITMAHGMLTLKFATGEAAQLATVDLSPEILSQALLHGLKQKLVDAAAIARNTETGASATTADKRDAVMKVLERLQSGEWNSRREGGTAVEKGSILLLALQRAKPTEDVAKLREWLQSRTEAERAAIGKNPKLMPFILQVQAERAAAAAEKAKKSGIDSDDLLAGLGL